MHEGEAAGPIPAQHIMLSMEVAAVIAGLKPCIVGHHAYLADLGKIWFERIFTPLQLDKIQL